MGRENFRRASEQPFIPASSAPTKDDRVARLVHSNGQDARCPSKRKLRVETPRPTMSEPSEPFRVSRVSASHPRQSCQSCLILHLTRNLHIYINAVVAMRQTTRGPEANFILPRLSLALRRHPPRVRAAFSEVSSIMGFSPRGHFATTRRSSTPGWPGSRTGSDPYSTGTSTSLPWLLNVTRWRYFISQSPARIHESGVHQPPERAAHGNLTDVERRREGLDGRQNVSRRVEAIADGTGESIRQLLRKTEFATTIK